MKLLLRLWWLQKRRNFKKRDLAVMIYLFIVYIGACVGFYLGATASGAPIERLYAPAFVGFIIVMASLVPDFIMKLSVKQDATFMDDYLKTRPIPEKLWNRFLLIINAGSFWNYIFPVLLLPLLILFLSTLQALACFLIMILFSYADSLFVTCFKRTSDRFLQFSLIGGWLLMLMVTSLFLALFFWADGLVLNLGMVLLGIAVMAGLTGFLANEDNYDESRHRTTRQRSFGRVTLFTMQFLGVLRARRLRFMVLILSIIIIADAYFMLWTSDGDDMPVTLCAILAVIMPSLVLSQWTFGVEGNFFQGLMTKPISVRHLLTNCFYFFLLLSLASSLFVAPLIFITPGFTPLMLIASLCLAVFVNLFNMPTCLFSSRLEIFSDSYFNMQGANMKINFYSLALLVPAGIFVGIWLLWGPTIWCVVSIATGVLSLTVHRLVIAKLASRFEARKYERIESFMN